MGEIHDELKAAIVLFFCLLDEQQRRLFAGLESLKWGYGGDRKVARLLGVDEETVARGRRQLLSEDIDVDRSRKPGGGRKPSEKKHRKSSRKKELMEFETAGGPMTGLKWTRKTTDKIAHELGKMGITVCGKTDGSAGCQHRHKEEGAGG
ncbi:MAG: hypothetical protein GY854_12705 [Deltaproteobacteria bacterium]|nr:hypothetical protein [Deltaproteobacteria bacterium]